MRVRKPAVAGVFYPSDKDELLSSIENSFLHPYGPGKIHPSDKDLLALICPHAGYMYSGPIAAHSYSLASSIRPDLVIILGPNHYGIGSGIATMKECVWQTPLGSVSVNDEAVDYAIKESGIIDIDFEAHIRDHSLEVQLPMLQYIYDHEFKILPIILWLQDKESADDLGKAIASVSNNFGSVLIIASSDLTHYEPNDVAYRKDSELIKAILDLDVSRYYTILERLNVTACGYGAIAAAMTAAKILGARKGELLKYATSGDITGDKSSVVGYSSIAFKDLS